MWNSPRLHCAALNLLILSTGLTVTDARYNLITQ